jgi:C4-dicarboxylate transporter, DctM subunit
MEKGNHMNMATPESGMVAVVILLILLLFGVPIGCALGLVGIAGLILTIGFEPALIKSGSVLFETVTRYELGTLPLFLFMAASIFGCAGFGTINGSSLATAATIGLAAVPEMRRLGYSDSLATGTVAAGGTLGQMIPPSGMLIVYGIIAEQSIGTLFTAAIIPGISQALFYCLVIYLVARWKPELAPRAKKASWAERIDALKRVSDVMLLIIVVITSIVTGIFTSSEAASIGAFGALLICYFRRGLTFSVLYHALAETLKTSGLIYTVVIGALVFSVFISITGLANSVADLITSIGGGAFVTVLLMALFLLLLGSVLDGLALMLLATPILLPVITSMGLSPIWFGIILVRATEIGFIHPPLGMNLYVIQSIAPDVSLSRIFRGVIPFLASDLVHLLLLIAFPVLVLGLPELMS